ncbi:MAG: helix-turn-helix domain-containing protein [Balneolaceae bacterium]|nr:helix-turn-helix domain-containing protein [Balneolaceae bacterium]
MPENGAPLDVQLAFSFMTKNLTLRDLDVNRLKEECNIFKRSFSIDFKLHTGFYPSEFVTHYRIELSKELVKKADGLSISEIAILSGFSSCSFFCKTFKRKVGCRPSKWRNKTLD